MTTSPDDPPSPFRPTHPSQGRVPQRWHGGEGNAGRRHFDQPAKQVQCTKKGGSFESPHSVNVLYGLGVLALPRAQINSIACCGNNDRQPDDPTCHSSPPRKWQRTMAPKKETTPTAAPHGLSPNTLTAILATVQLKRKSASFEIVCLFIPHLCFQDSHFHGMCRGFEFSVTPLLSHSVAARPDFWGQPRRAVFSGRVVPRLVENKLIDFLS